MTPEALVIIVPVLLLVTALVAFVVVRRSAQRRADGQPEQRTGTHDPRTVANVESVLREPKERASPGGSSLEYARSVLCFLCLVASAVPFIGFIPMYLSGQRHLGDFTRESFVTFGLLTVLGAFAFATLIVQRRAHFVAGVLFFGTSASMTFVDITCNALAGRFLLSVPDFGSVPGPVAEYGFRLLLLALAVAGLVVEIIHERRTAGRGREPKERASPGGSSLEYARSVLCFLFLVASAVPFIGFIPMYLSGQRHLGDFTTESFVTFGLRTVLGAFAFATLMVRRRAHFVASVLFFGTWASMMFVDVTSHALAGSVFRSAGDAVAEYGFRLFLLTLSVAGVVLECECRRGTDFWIKDGRIAAWVITYQDRDPRKP